MFARGRGGINSRILAEGEKGECGRGRRGEGTAMQIGGGGNGNGGEAKTPKFFLLFLSDDLHLHMYQSRSPATHSRYSFVSLTFHRVLALPEVPERLLDDECLAGPLPVLGEDEDLDGPPSVSSSSSSSARPPAPAAPGAAGAAKVGHLEAGLVVRHLGPVFVHGKKALKNSNILSSRFECNFFTSGRLPRTAPGGSSGAGRRRNLWTDTDT